MQFPLQVAPRASVLVVAVVASLLSASGTAQAQGVTPYDTFRDAWGAPAYTSNLTTLPDDRDLLGPGPAPLLTMSDPFSERVRPARGYGEIGDPDADYFEAQADLTRQKAQSLQALDDQRRAR